MLLEKKKRVMRMQRERLTKQWLVEELTESVPYALKYICQQEGCPVLTFEQEEGPEHILLAPKA